jgi:hypothetical protein
MRASSSSPTNGLPFEALFAARDALFGPIPVVVVAEAARLAQRARVEACYIESLLPGSGSSGCKGGIGPRPAPKVQGRNRPSLPPGL